MDRYEHGEVAPTPEERIATVREALDELEADLKQRASAPG
jgi:hypothetical protein